MKQKGEIMVAMVRNIERFLKVLDQEIEKMALKLF